MLPNINAARLSLNNAIAQVDSALISLDNDLPRATTILQNARTMIQNVIAELVNNDTLTRRAIATKQAQKYWRNNQNIVNPPPNVQVLWSDLSLSERRDYVDTFMQIDIDPNE